MTKQILIALALLSSVSAYAGAGAELVVNCNDAKHETNLVIDRLTGATGGVPGTYLAVVTRNGAALGMPEVVKKSYTGDEGDLEFRGANVTLILPAIQPMDLPFSEVRGTLSYGDELSTTVVCTKGPAYTK
jgi:hypothetical protein